LSVVPEYVEVINDRISEVAGRTSEVNNNLYQLILSIQSRILEVDSRGNVLAGYLPFTTQAALYHGVNIVSVFGDILYYPGTGGNIFDPMLGSFMMSSNQNDVVFSLVGAPAGISIDKRGLITVSKGAALNKENYIAVQAEYAGQTYRATLYIKCGVYTPRYLGACYTAVGTQTVKVKIGGETVTYIANQGDWVAYLGPKLENSIWEVGAVMRWNGTQWEKVDPTARSDSALYIAAFDDLLEDAPSARFLTAIVGTIFTRHIEMTGDGEIRSKGFDNINSGVNGFRFTAKDGLLQAIGARFREGTFDSITVTGDSTFSGMLQAATGRFTGHIEADSGYFKGRIEASEGFFKGTLEAKDIVINGQITQGTDNLIRANNKAEEFSVNGGTSDVLKELKTAARGTATIRIGIWFYASNSTANLAEFGYRIIVNGVAGTWLVPTGMAQTIRNYDHNITLTENINTIGIQLKTPSAGGTAQIRNTTFELRCKEKPGLLALLG
jgi:hypothetical protein